MTKFLSGACFTIVAAAIALWASVGEGAADKAARFSQALRDRPTVTRPGLLTHRNPAAVLIAPRVPRTLRETTGTAGSGERLSPDELKRQLQAHGFNEVANVRLMGDHYVVQAVGPRGQRMTLVINAATSEIAGARLRGK